MTLLTKLADSKEGLMGITEDGEKVHLGVPVSRYYTEEFNSETFKDGKEIREKQLKKKFREDSRSYWYFDSEINGHHNIPSSPDKLSFTWLYFRFGREKEDSYKRMEI